MVDQKSKQFKRKCNKNNMVIKMKVRDSKEILETFNPSSRIRTTTKARKTLTMKTELRIKYKIP